MTLSLKDGLLRDSVIICPMQSVICNVMLGCNCSVMLSVEVCVDRISERLSAERLQLLQNRKKHFENQRDKIKQQVNGSKSLSVSVCLQNLCICVHVQFNDIINLLHKLTSAVAIIAAAANSNSSTQIFKQFVRLF